ncbi:MAG TPA: FtsW/RodA/SpoVE family cell cycle protein, partial [Bacillota bacterium]
MVFSRRYWRNADFLLLTCVAALALYGLIVLASATRTPLSEMLRIEHWLNLREFDFVQRQMLWIGAGMVTIIACQLFDYRALARWAHILYGISLALLVVVLFVGSVENGSARWISFGPLQMQPSEFAKVALVVTLATVLANRDEAVESWTDIGRPFLYIVPPLALIIKQPDLGTALVLLGIFAGMLVIAGIPLLRFALLTLGGLAAAIGAVLLKLYFDAPIPLKDYQLRRLIIFLNPGSDPFGDGYHILQSQYAVGSGQLFGQG